MSKLDNNKVVSLFTGAGGLDLGLEWAGFETAVCVEIDPDCVETVRHNRPDWKFVTDNGGRPIGDVRKVAISRLLETAGLKKGEAALVVGGAPCQSFSNIGKKKGKEDEKNGDLFMEFVRVVGGVRPRGFIFENVLGITQSRHRDVLDYMTKQFTSMGYGVSYGVLNAADYGVAQKRERFFMLGSLKGRPAMPTPTHGKTKDAWRRTVADADNEDGQKEYRRWVTVKEAFRRIPENARLRSDYALMNISETVRGRMKRVGIDENFKVLPMGMRPKCWQNGGHRGQDTFGRLNPNAPSVTIRTSAYNPSTGKYIHPTEHRGLSSVEMAVLQSFPPAWVFRCKDSNKVTLLSVGRQIGNAVPPLLARAIGTEMRRAL